MQLPCPRHTAQDMAGNVPDAPFKAAHHPSWRRWSATARHMRMHHQHTAACSARVRTPTPTHDATCSSNRSGHPSHTQAGRRTARPRQPPGRAWGLSGTQNASGRTNRNHACAETSRSSTALVPPPQAHLLAAEANSHDTRTAATPSSKIPSRGKAQGKAAPLGAHKAGGKSHHHSATHTRIF